MARKTFIIRKIAYMYNDEFHFRNTLGSIEGRFTNETQAYQRLMELEVPMFRTWHLNSIEPIASYTIDNHQANKFQELDKYLKETVGETIFVSNDDGKLYADYALLSKELTDEQIMKVRELSGVRFHEMNIFDDEVVFYAIWLPSINTFFQIDEQVAISGIPYPREHEEYQRIMKTMRDTVYFYNTYEEALNVASQYFKYWYEDHASLGAIETLSDQPLLLQSFINTTDGIVYDENKQIIVMDKHFQNKDQLTLNTLLKQPVFEIREFAYELAKEMPHDPYEFM